MDSEGTIVARVGSAIRLNAADRDKAPSVLVGPTASASVTFRPQQMTRMQAARSFCNRRPIMLRREINLESVWPTAVL